MSHLVLRVRRNVGIKMGGFLTLWKTAPKQHEAEPRTARKKDAPAKKSLQQKFEKKMANPWGCILENVGKKGMWRWNKSQESIRQKF